MSYHDFQAILAFFTQNYYFQHVTKILYKKGDLNLPFSKKKKRKKKKTGFVVKFDIKNGF